MGFATHPDVNEIIQVAGYLFWNPTDLSNEAGWGTKLGFCSGGIIFSPNYKIATFRQEETGVEVYKKIYLGCAPVLTAVLKNWNSTLLERLFPGLSSGGAVEFPGSIPAGTDLSAYSHALIFVPQDTDNHPCLLFQKACPNIVEASKLKFSHRDPTVFPVAFDGLRKSSSTDGIAYFGPLSGAVLR
ncbi:MAG: hypothetical protein DRI56_03230 [Chloroflexota bacterium]|nr:MAG: hypothetical protein DRI56_03230 [Chloroflexota bacterium]